MAKKLPEVNFIKHLLTVSEKFIDDQRLSPLHISLYYALFQSWNLSMFRNPISVCREELMQASKIGSANTYTKCLKELDEWAYIQYLPSHNPHKGSKIYLYNFNKTTDNGIDNSTDKSTDKTNAQGPVKALRPSTNSSNNKNNLKPNKHEHTRSKTKDSTSSASNKVGGSGTKEKSSGKKEKPLSRRAVSRRERPLLSQVRTYFIEKKWPLLEAEKFFNHYTSNGWLVGGKTPMKNWQASAKKWMLNSKDFSLSGRVTSSGKVYTEQSRSEKKGELTPGKLSITNDKNYGEPL